MADVRRRDPVAGTDGDHGERSLRSARVRLAALYSVGLAAVAALTVGAIYLLLSRTLEVDVTTTRRTTEAPDGDDREEATTGRGVDGVTEREVAQRTLDGLRDASLVSVSALAGGSVLLGWFIAGRVLAPVAAAMEARRRFVRDASHELRNPLATMRVALDLALEDPDTSPAGWRETGGTVRDAVDRMAEVVDTLLDDARRELPAADGATGVDCPALLARLGQQVRPSATRRDVTVDVQAESARLVGERAPLERALANVLDNAARHAPEGSLITLRGTRTPTTYEVRVTDAGPGVPDGDRDRVFERGHRGAASPGLGRGLPIARDVVEARGGTIGIERTGPGGTTFVVRLPLPDPHD